MIKTKAELLTQNDDYIYDNVNREITADHVHDHLEDVIDSAFIKKWTIYFSSVLDEVELVHESTVTISEVILGNAVTVQYSTDGGTIWTNYTTPITITTSLSRWRVSDFGSATDGSIIIKGI